MNFKTQKDRTIFEVMLLIVVIGMSYVVYEMGPYKMVALNLFFLPIVLSGYYLGRTSAGVLALFCALGTTIATTFNPGGIASYDNPIMMGLAITVWAAVLGLTAILVGTLCDERAAKVDELHEAYVGVVEVLSRYLQSADPRIKGKSTRMAEMCQSVAEQLNLSRKEVDDVRVGALLCDLGNVEITTKLISKAMNSLEAQPGPRPERHTFLGVDLMQSLGSVLHGAVPLMMNQEDALRDALELSSEKPAGEAPIGARIIRAVRAFDTLLYSSAGTMNCTPQAALRQLRKEAGSDHDQDVVDAIGKVVRYKEAMPEPEPAFA